MTGTKTLVTALLAAGALAMQVPATMAAPTSTIHAVSPAATGVTIEHVQWRGGYRGGYRGGWGGRGIGIGAGILGGAIIGGALAAPYYYRPYPYYPAPRYYAAPPSGGADAYCFSRFRSYDPASGTYLGFDGYRHPCP